MLNDLMKVTRSQAYPNQPLAFRFNAHHTHKDEHIRCVVKLEAVVVKEIIFEETFTVSRDYPRNCILVDGWKNVPGNITSFKLTITLFSNITDDAKLTALIKFNRKGELKTPVKCLSSVYNHSINLTTEMFDNCVKLLELRGGRHAEVANIDVHQCSMNDRSIDLLTNRASCRYNNPKKFLYSYNTRNTAMTMQVDSPEFSSAVCVVMIVTGRNKEIIGRWKGITSMNKPFVLEFDKLYELMEGHSYCDITVDIYSPLGLALAIIKDRVQRSTVKLINPEIIIPEGYEHHLIHL